MCMWFGRDLDIDQQDLARRWRIKNKDQQANTKQSRQKFHLLVSVSVCLCCDTVRHVHACVIMCLCV